MSRVLRFLKRAARSERRTSKPRRHTLGHSPNNRRLGCELLEPRMLLSVSVELPAGIVGMPVLPTGGRIRPADTSPSGLSPNQVRGAYGLGSYTNGVLSNGLSFAGVSGDGRGQTIAIVDAYDDPTALTDVNAFSTAFGLPTFNNGADSPTFQQLTQTGQPVSRTSGSSSYVSTDPSGAQGAGDDDWEGEESLDIEWAHSIAPMANVILFEASSDSDASDDLYTAVETAANTPGVVCVSMSWGGAESDLTASQVSTFDSTVFTTPTGHLGGSATMGGTDLAGGVTFLASAGDNGAYQQNANGNFVVGPQYPASSRNVVAVGGTSLTVDGSNPNYTYGGETAWGDGVNSGMDGGGGGGISGYESQPAYQNGVVNAYSTTNRTYPDVSMNADRNTGVSVYDSWDYGASSPWVVVGGTSLACPMWAGIIAITDESLAISGQGSLDGPSQTLPDLYKLPAADFHDITTGSNGPSPKYNAGPGYDLASGLGSPVANSLIPDLTGHRPTVTGVNPDFGPAAGGTTVIITGTNFSDGSIVEFGTTRATNVDVVSATEITATSPAGAGTVNVIVDGSGGASATSAADQFTYSPTVTDVSPFAGTLAGGVVVTITGTGLSGATLVDFGTSAATNVAVNSAGTQITATDPAEAAGTVDVTVTTPAGTSPTSSADQFTYEGVPTLTAITPSQGSETGGTQVTITGTGFIDTTLVDFGTTPATNVVVVSATEITVISPAEPVGTVDVTVVAAGGTSVASSADQYTYLPVVVTRLTALNGSAGAYFGKSISISGDTMVVGAPATTVGNNTNQGAVYVFTEIGSTWTETAMLTASNGASDAYFGNSVSISGDTIVVGAENATIGGNIAQGVAYIFTEPDSGWANMTQTAELTASDGTGHNQFGTSVAIDGSTVVVGSAGANLFRGTAYVFTEPGSGWANMTQTAELTASDGAAYAYFGTSVSVSGNTVVVGAGDATVAGNTAQGAAYIYTEPGSGWVNMTQSAKLIASKGGAGDEFGVSVSIGGDTVIVGAGNATVGANIAQGAAYVFTGSGSAWSQAAELTASNGAEGDDFGTSVSISGSTVVVGTFAANSLQGAAYLFSETGSAWAQTTELTASDGVAGDEFGASVSISGSTPAIGAPNATVGGSPYTGAAYVFGFSALSAGLALPAVTGVSQATGPAAGGNSVTVTGTNLADATAVKFGAAAAIIVSDTPTQIVVESPAGSGTAYVTVTTDSGVSAISSADKFTYVAPPAPTVASISASSGAAAGGTQVTITGTNLAGATAVRFGTASASIVSDTSTQIVVESPAGTGTAYVTVTTASGVSTSSSADKFTYVAAPAPTVSSISPSSGTTAGGTQVTITGKNLTGATAVKFGTATAIIVSDTSTQIVVKSPAGSGTAYVTVITSGGTSSSSSTDKFTYVAPKTAATTKSAVSAVSAAALVPSVSQASTKNALSQATVQDLALLEYLA